ncbi:DUF6636 domain-containing protein [Pseudotabrizicola sp. 4114]|uniref:DUF6636 domain-containing protein n=1 Tax=Pseudotabrizicola sp. 4114 TaxID=2817731 RepID=UPI002863270E|nr:hypothetical protein [Pseudorhodobacter sp. 4114]
MRLILTVAALAAGPAMAEDFYAFQSPTGNIGCYIAIEEETMARCDLAEFTPSFQDSGDCELDFGHAFAVGQYGRAGAICAGDSALNDEAEVLEYGEEIYIEGITCWSEPTGMSCANDNGHGFSVSKRSQEVF